MPRVGIGIKLLAAMAVTFLLTGILTYLVPGIFRIDFISASTLRVAAIALITIGLVLKLSSSRVPSIAFKNKGRVTTGIFSYIRHPMYSSWILFIAPGIALLFRSWLMLGASLVGYLSFRNLTKEEDEYLTRMFGQSYLDYRSRVGEITPIIRSRRKH
jgi:protein-S-isoprenylcysteine O-methyltransferase Ste14